MNADDQERKVIGTETYLVTKMDAISALQVQTKLIKLLGPGVIALLGKETSVKDKIELLVPKLMENFDDTLVNTIIKDLFAIGVFIEVDVPGSDPIPKKVDFAQHFRGRIMEMWKVAMFILEVNFASGESLESLLPTTKKAKETHDNLM